ncbi:hypothetical protein M430DRAFT_199732 [Amorphotheca resinae ATCC 22711]|uniref:Uncharacterized protein n=1 Tax=Amorphotheca resinae ATCC 22711 TaxID=857342 RepID=A0A2T3BA70_AMORE|nr:hypothetical protein M430DRAFT_199732 [Amorphotheca resinae ATCC 22711]PSS25227.1 hypothetical protein M430DRAFT_199732 [Amorphotheca resinae ATCC 22711]
MFSVHIGTVTHLVVTLFRPSVVWFTYLIMTWPKSSYNTYINHTAACPSSTPRVQIIPHITDY